MKIKATYSDGTIAEYKVVPASILYLDISMGSGNTVKVTIEDRSGLITTYERVEDGG